MDISKFNRKQLTIINKNFSLCEKIRYYSTSNASTLSREIKTISSIKINPWFITGLTDAEGCFNVSISKRPYKKNYEVQVRFIIEIHIKEIDLLFKIQSFSRLWRLYAQAQGIGKISKITVKMLLDIL